MQRLREDTSKQASRPRIPREVERQVLTEAGHRCAVCGESCPVERAHIVPWRRVKEHTAENLICLCANCHRRADAEKWGAKTLQVYKLKPWVLRKGIDRAKICSRSKVEIKLALDLDEFDENYRRLLVHGLAGFLGISPDDVQIVSVGHGSVKVVLELPSVDALILERAFRGQNETFDLFLGTLPVSEVRLEEYGEGEESKASGEEGGLPVLESPSTELESGIAIIFEELLGVDEVGVNDNFFELGGDSLMGVQFVNRLREKLDGSISLRELFSNPTVGALARELSLTEPPEERRAAEESVDEVENAPKKVENDPKNREIRRPDEEMLENR